MSIQTGWASCRKCQGLFFAPFKGVCPAGGAHDQTNSFSYSAEYAVPASANVQTGSASCPKCQGLHVAGFLTKGVCPAGGQHTEANSFPYVLRHNVTAASAVQDGWPSCRKCQGLFYGPFQGHCPTGGSHDPQGSFPYVLDYTAPSIPAIDKAYRAHNGAWGRLGPLVGFPVHNQDGSVTQNTALDKLVVRDGTANAPVAAESQYSVSVGLQAVHCFGTLANWPDNTDALYAIVSLAPYGLSTTADAAYSTPVTVRTAIENTQQHDTKLQNVPIGSVVPGGAGAYIHISLWQHKAGDPDKIRDTIHQGLNDLVNKASDVALEAAADPGVTGSTVGDITNQKIAGISISDLTLGLANAITGQFFADRLIAEHTYNLALENVLALADPATRARSKYTDPDLPPDIQLNWPPTAQLNPLLSGGGASYKAYFAVTTTLVPTPMF